MARAATPQRLKRYKDKRDFTVTTEPKPRLARQPSGRSFVIQKHWASSLHYDFRLELDGVLVSWAVPKGPSLDPKVKRMAIHVEDHPVSYASFEGKIPAGQYGAGEVIVWDRGTWEPVGDARDGLNNGKLAFRLHGDKLAGLWELIRTAKPGDKQEHWLLFKKSDEWARAADDYDVTTALPDSVIRNPLRARKQRKVHAVTLAVCHLDMSGVSESTAETAMAVARVTANSRKRRPMIPPMKSSGINTATSDTVSDTMVKPICRAPSSAASNGFLPAST